MIKEISIKVKNYKCFGDLEQGFDKIFPINIIIGKNNSGKSSLIDLIEYNTIRNSNILFQGNFECIISWKISQEIIDTAGTAYGKSRAHQPTQQQVNYNKKILIDSISSELLNSVLTAKLSTDHRVNITSNTPNFTPFKQSFESVLKSPFEGRFFKRINAERDVTIEGSNDNLVLKSNGTGATNMIRGIINKAKYRTDLIFKDLLEAINFITKPDIEFSAIYAQDNENGNWEIYFKDLIGNIIPLSKMGSGIKTILLVLLNLVVLPDLENIPKNSLVLGFEELENNLHPSLQRRLFNYLLEYAKENKAYFFITTHSSIIIDLFSSSNDAQIIHIENNGKSSITKTVQTHLDGKNILKDLDYKSSDLLLCNGIIWVEGPSDAIYLELLLDLYKKSIKASSGRLNYTIQSLATAIWKYAGFVDFDWEKIGEDIQNQIISLAKLNHNHLLVIDKDDNYEDKKPSEWNLFTNGTGQNKAKLIHESIQYGSHNESQLRSNQGDTEDGKLFFWINDGTFETYLKYFIENKGKEKFEKYFEINAKRKYFEKRRKDDDSSKSKVELAAEIAKFCIDEKVSIDDIAPKDSALLNKIERLYKTIKESWN